MTLRSAMSSGSSKACSTASATYPAFPCWKSLIEEFIRRGDLSNTRGEFWFGTLVRRLCPLSPGALLLKDLVWVVLATLAPLWGSFSLRGTPRPSSITSFPFCSRFLFLFASLGWGSWRVGREGCLAWPATLGALPPAWDSMISRRLALGLCCIPIASRTEESPCV